MYNSLLVFFLIAILLSSCKTAGHHQASRTDSVNTKAKSVTLVGTASNAKGGAVLVTSNEKVYYIDGLERWNDALYKRNVEVKGKLVKMRYLPVSLTDAKGNVSQGTTDQGLQHVIQNASYKLTD